MLDQKLDAAKTLISSIGQEKMALDEMTEKYKKEEESYQQHKALYDKAAEDLNKEDETSQPFLDGALEALSKVINSRRRLTLFTEQKASYTFHYCCGLAAG